MNIKKTLAGIASYALVGAVALGIGGSLAYQTDETVSADNTFVSGDIEIEQLEYQRAEGVKHINAGAVEGDLVPFEQNKMIMPAVPLNNLATDYSAEPSNLFMWGAYSPGGNGLWDDSKLSNVMDKFVFVKNTGDNPCYYRTVIAFECPEGAVYGEPAAGADFMINVNSRFTWEEKGHIEIEGTRYLLMTATYNEVLTPDETSRPSLLQVVMTHHADNALVEALGDEYEIKVVSQAVQYEEGLSAAEMLQRAFGDITTDSNPWKATATTAEALEDAIVTGGEITVAKDIALTSATTVLESSATVMLNGTITADRSDTSGADKFSALTVNSEVTLTGEGAITNTGGYTISVRDEDAVLTIESGTYTGNTSAVNVVKGTLYIKGGTFEDTGTEDNGHYLINCIDANYKNGTAKVVITGGKFKNWNPENNTSEGAGTNFVADGYRVTSETDTNGDVWYTVVAE